MAGAIAVGLLAFAIARKRTVSSYLGLDMKLPTAPDVAPLPCHELLRRPGQYDQSSRLYVSI